MYTEKTSFGITPDGHEIFLYTLKNNRNMSVKVMNYGAIIVSIIVEGKTGEYDDVVLGFDNLEEYAINVPFFGSTIGRNANRIADASVTINEIKYNLDKNEGNNMLHGGFNGYHKRIWDVHEFNENMSKIQFKLLSPDGDQGFPGNLEISVTFSLNDENELAINYYAVTDQDTIVNLTNHSYFNLGGHDSGDILKHKLWMDADQYTPISNSMSIPKGTCESVKDTPMDFRKGRRIGDSIDSSFEQIEFANGYDHNWVLKTEKGKVKKVISVINDQSNRKMEVFTDLPGVQFYSGNFLDGSIRGKNDVPYQKRSGFCLETQFFPDAVHHEEFETPILSVDSSYNSKTIYKFSKIK